MSLFIIGFLGEKQAQNPIRWRSWPYGGPVSPNPPDPECTAVAILFDKRSTSSRHLARPLDNGANTIFARLSGKARTFVKGPELMRWIVAPANPQCLAQNRQFCLLACQPAAQHAIC